jgi:glycerol-3-phosphate cytidylyltransferase
MKIGFTSGVFDLFHIGHLNIIKKAKKNCDFLIVAVTNDNLAFKLKNKKPVISFKERYEIIKSIKFVDKVVEEKVDDKILAKKKYNFDIIFKGDDWKNSKKWKYLKKELNTLNTEVVFLKYTKNTSSTLIKKVCEKIYRKK